MSDSTPSTPPPEDLPPPPLPPLPPAPPLPTFGATNTPAFPAPPKPPPPPPGSTPAFPAAPPLGGPPRETSAFPPPPLPPPQAGTHTPAFPSNPSVPKAPAFPGAAAPPPPPPSFPGAAPPPLPGSPAGASPPPLPPPPAETSGDTAWMMQYAAPIKKPESVPGARSAAERAAALDLSGLPQLNTGIGSSPWEDQNKDFLSRWWETTLAVVTRPMEFFAEMPTTGGPNAPLTYAMIGGVLGMLLQTFCQFPMEMVAGGLGQTTPAIQDALPGAAGGLGGGVAAAFCCAPFAALLAVYIRAGLMHLGLSIAGGANGDFETTLRVASYSYGAVTPLASIPLVGCLLGIYGLVVDGIGLHKAHQCEVWQAVVAVLAPIILCVGLIGGVVGLAVLGSMA